MASDVNQWTPGVTRPGYYPRAPSACVETRMVENPNYDPVVSLLTVGHQSTMLDARKGCEVIMNVRHLHEPQLGGAVRSQSSLDECDAVQASSHRFDRVSMCQ